MGRPFAPIISTLQLPVPKEKSAHWYYYVSKNAVLVLRVFEMRTTRALDYDKAKLGC
jgi:hypothetical protein